MGQYKKRLNKITNDFNLRVISNGKGKTDFEHNIITDSDLFGWTAIESIIYNDEIDYEDFQEIYTDGTDDASIDFLISEYRAFVQVKDQNLDIYKIMEYFNDIIKTIRNLEAGSDINPKTNKKISNKILEVFNADFLNENSQSVIYLIFKEKHTDFDVEELTNWVKNKESETGYRLEWFDRATISQYMETEHKKNQKLDLDDKSKESKDQKRVKEFKFKFNNQNILINDNSNLVNLSGIIVNISIIDLFRAYDLYQEKLFFDNVRNYISGKNGSNGIVNLGIEKTLRSYPDIFWFANNGVVALCKKIIVNYDEITITDFSFINGAQTISQIYYWLLNKDLSIYSKIKIPCKIISKMDDFLFNGNNNNWSDSEFSNFITKSTNSQKQILPWTFVFNEKEIITVQEYLLKNNIYLKTKDGILTQKIKGSFTTENIVKLPDYTQWAKSTINLTPGKAMQRKNKLFLEQNEYKETFNKINLSIENSMLPILVKRDFENIKKMTFFKENTKQLNRIRQWVLSLLSINRMDKDNINDIIKIIEEEKFWTSYDDLSIKWNLMDNFLMDEKICNKIKSLLQYTKDKELSFLYKDQNFLDFYMEKK